jgi:hypothetical protein
VAWWGNFVETQDALKLTWLDLILIGSIAIAALWIGKLTIDATADTIMGYPRPSISFEIQHGVSSTEDSLATIEKQQKDTQLRLAADDVLLVEERQMLTSATGAKVASLRMQVSTIERLVNALSRSQQQLLDDHDKTELALDEEQTAAGKSQARSSSIRRVEVWLIQVAYSVGLFALFLGVVMVFAPPGKTGIHVVPVAVGAAFLLAALLITSYASWIALALLLVVILIFIARRVAT